MVRLVTYLRFAAMEVMPLPRQWGIRVGPHRCSRCRRTPDEVSFYKGSSGGLYAFCKECSRLVERERDQGKPGWKPRRWRPPARDGQLLCTKCERWRDLENFAKALGKKSGYKSHCVDCCLESDRAREAAKTIKTKVRNNLNECECRRRKAPDAAACPRCMLLDGVGAAAVVISALRLCGGTATSYELADETGYTVRHLLRVCPTVARVERQEKAALDGGHDKTEWRLMGVKT